MHQIQSTYFHFFKFYSHFMAFHGKCVAGLIDPLLLSETICFYHRHCKLLLQMLCFYHRQSLSQTLHVCHTNCTFIVDLSRTLYVYHTHYPFIVDPTFLSQAPNFYHRYYTFIMDTRVLLLTPRFYCKHYKLITDIHFFQNITLLSQVLHTYHEHDAYITNIIILS